MGGLAIFLLGMEQMTEALKLVAGDRLRGLLLRLTKNRFVGMLTGAGITAIIQSSSVTTVMAVGFISAGLMTFTQSIGVIVGANIGTTITAQIIAFKVTTYALYAVAVGFAITFFSKRGSREGVGHRHSRPGTGLPRDDPHGRSRCLRCVTARRSSTPWWRWRTP